MAAETAISWFARKRWNDYCSQSVRAQLHEHEVTRLLSVPLERVSVVTACMNRTGHILETLPTWLASDRFEEIIIVDFGSRDPLQHTLSQYGFFDDPRVKIVRVEAEIWCLAEAFNIGLFQANAPFTLKLDADTLLRGRAEMSLRLSAQQFRTGNWRTFHNRSLNGVVLAPTNAIKKSGGYNEQIRCYGWDDCDFYERLSEFSLIKTDLYEREFQSLDHSDDQRVANSESLARSVDINRLIQGNRVLANLLPKWTDKGKRQFPLHSLDHVEQELLAKIRDTAYKISEIQDKYLYTQDSVFGYGEMLRDLAAQLSRDSSHYPRLPSQRQTPIVLMVSLYEDASEIRRREMIRCLRINCQFFDRIIVLYEKPLTEGALVNDCVFTEVQRIVSISRCEKHLADIQTIETNQHPAYRDFFHISMASKPDGERPWYVIANSDVAFDSSIRRIYELDQSDNSLVMLSRWDKCSEDSLDTASECYLDSDGVKWSLIRANVNGSTIPNYLSADAWIYRDPPVDWDQYTYKLGTYFCDSFVANRAFRSGRRVINPCRSIRCFHYHDESINSSAQKFQNKNRIEQLHHEERVRLGGDDPVAGVQWTTLETCTSPYLNLTPYRWNPKGGLWLRLGHVVNVVTTMLMIEAALKATEATGQDLFVSIISDDRFGALGPAVLEFAAYLKNPRLFIDLIQGVFDPAAPTSNQHFRFLREHALSPGNWGLIAASITTHIEANPHAHYSDRCHLELLQLLTIEELYTVSFISAHQSGLLQQHLAAARYAVRVSNSHTPTHPPKFSLITSLFRSKKYLPRLLENFEAIASLGPCEIVIVDVNQDSSDRDIIKAFASRSEYGHMIQYIQLREDPGIYGCWMQAISMAKSPFVSSFNADDRRSALHPHLLADYLETHLDVDVCCTALKPTNVANLSWYEHDGVEAWFNWYETGRRFSLKDFVTERDGVYCSQNVAHCMPMWRKSLHEQLGPIREDKYGTSADWAFWLECLKSNKTVSLASNLPLGLYYVNPASHNRTHDTLGELENKILFDYYGICQQRFLQQ